MSLTTAGAAGGTGGMGECKCGAEDYQRCTRRAAVYGQPGTPGAIRAALDRVECPYHDESKAALEAVGHLLLLMSR